MNSANTPLETLSDLQFNSFVGQVHLWPLAIMVALLLGHVFYTDYFKGHKISNTTSMGFFTLSFTAALFLYSNLTVHFIFAALFIGFLLILFIFADFGGGDLKIYAGLALLIGPAVILLMVISSLFTLLINIPMIVENRRQHKAENKPGRAKLGKAPLGPGIAISFPLVLLILGLNILLSAVFLLAILLSVVYYYFDDKITEKALQSEKDKQDLGLDQQYSSEAEILESDRETSEKSNDQ
jgi:Flp pilus assembly protein protease CpaA